jgi:hypothetical protein
MAVIEDEVRARRVARAIVDNVEQYNPELVKKGLKESTIFELLHDQIEEARVEFNSRVTPDIAASKIFDYALVDVLIKRAYIKHGADCGK